MKPVRLVDYSRLYFDLSRDWISDPEISRLIDAGALPGNSDRESWFMSLPNRLDYKIWGVEYEGTPVGVCGLKHITNHEAEYWGYIGEKQYWGKGLGTVMMQLNESEAKKLDLTKLNLKVLLSNIRAIGLYKKVGYQEYYKDDKYAYYSKSL